MKEIRKQKKKKKKSEPTGPIPAQPAQHPHRRVRWILSAARPHSARARRPTYPIFPFISSIFQNLSTQILISQVLQRLFRIRLFLHVSNLKPYLTNQPTPLYIALTSVHLYFFPRNPEILSPKTLTRIFESLNFIICLWHINESCISRQDASIPTNLISFRSPQLEQVGPHDFRSDGQDRVWRLACFSKTKFLRWVDSSFNSLQLTYGEFFVLRYGSMSLK
jgi:hypothetical protein